MRTKILATHLQAMMVQFKHFGLCGRITSQLTGDDLARHAARALHTLEKTFGRGFIAALLYQVELSAVLIDCAPQQVRLATQRHKYFVKVPCGAGLATRRFHAACEACTELIAPASDRFVADDNPALEQEFFYITRSALKPEIPAHRATDVCRRKPMTVVKRFCILHPAILLDHLSNVTVLWHKFDVPSSTVT
jgi:hypothetical protein